jgi:hypothetical protein
VNDLLWPLEGQEAESDVVQERNKFPDPDAMASEELDDVVHCAFFQKGWIAKACHRQCLEMGSHS